MFPHCISNYCPMMYGVPQAPPLTFLPIICFINQSGHSNFSYSPPSTLDREGMTTQNTEPSAGLENVEVISPKLSGPNLPNSIRPLQIIQNSAEPNPTCLSSGKRLSLKPALAPRKKYLRKNTESNLSNQAFSFLCSPNKSSLTLMRLLGSQEAGAKQVCRLFYSYALVLKKHRKKYLNKKLLLQISVEKSGTVLKHILESKAYADQLPMGEFCRLARSLLHYYLANVCPMSILTSKKLSKETRLEHFARRRQIQDYLRNKGPRLPKY